jgi:hypothetical protein
LFLIGSKCMVAKGMTGILKGKQDQVKNFMNL